MDITSNLKSITVEQLAAHNEMQKLIDAKAKELFWYYQTLRDKIFTGFYFKRNKNILSVKYDYVGHMITYKTLGDHLIEVLPTSLLTSRTWFSELETIVQIEQENYIANKLCS